MSNTVTDSLLGPSTTDHHNLTSDELAAVGRAYRLFTEEGGQTHSQRFTCDTYRNDTDVSVIVLICSTRRTNGLYAVLGELVITRCDSQAYTGTRFTHWPAGKPHTHVDDNGCVVTTH